MCGLQIKMAYNVTVYFRILRRPEAAGHVLSCLIFLSGSVSVFGQLTETWDKVHLCKEPVLAGGDPVWAQRSKLTACETLSTGSRVTPAADVLLAGY